MENGASRHGRGFTLWFTGLSGAGKTTIAEIVEKELRARHGKIEVLDGDIVRTNLSCEEHRNRPDQLRFVLHRYLLYFLSTARASARS